VDRRHGGRGNRRPRGRRRGGPHEGKRPLTRKQGTPGRQTQQDPEKQNQGNQDGGAA
jgi:hypothetical protein